MTPIPKEDALEACKKCTRHGKDKDCICGDIEGSKGDIHNPPECLIFQFKKIFEGEHPHPTVSTGTDKPESKGITKSAPIKEQWAAQVVESWEEEHEPHSTRNEGATKTNELKEKPHKKNHTRSACTKACTTKNQEQAVCTIKTDNKRHGTRNGKIMVQCSRAPPKGMHWFFDDANMKILESITNGHIQEYIVKHSSLSKNATISRLKRMVQEKILEKNVVQDEIDINRTHIIYKQTKACTKLLVGDEDGAQHQDFRSHHQKWKFSLIHEAENIKRASAIPCVNIRQLKNHAEKDFFRDSMNTIRLTTKHVCVFIKQRLESDSIDNLNAKYIELAKKEARDFCDEHNIKVDPVPTRYQKNDFDCISAEPLAKIMREEGNFNIKSAGIEARVDPSDKGIESDEENAREIEYRLFKMPLIMKDLQQAMNEQTIAIGKLAEEHKADTLQLQEFIKTIGDNQIKMIEATKAMSESIKKIAEIFTPKENQQIEPNRNTIDEGALRAYG